MSTQKALTWLRCTGRNTYDHPLDVSADMGTEALNVDLEQAALGLKRTGLVEVTLAGDVIAGVAHMFAFVPGQDETLAELWVIGQDRLIYRIASSATAVRMTANEPFTISNNTGRQFSVVALNRKLFFAWASAENRIAVFNSDLGTVKLYRQGLAAASAPTVANTGAGTYAATPRWYAQAYRKKVSTRIVSQGEFSAGVAFTPSGTGTHARVTKSATISEDETHWVLAASADSITGPFYEIAETAVGTTTYDDNAVPSTYNGNTAIPIVNTHLPFPAVRFLATDGVRLLGLGNYMLDTGQIYPRSGRLYFTPPTGASANPSQDDDERWINALTQKNFLDLGSTAGGVDRALAGPIQGNFYAFQSRGIYAIVPTNSDTAPYRCVPLSFKLGAVSNESTIIGVDENGSPCLYFLDPADGPRRITHEGRIQWLGKEVQDIWATVNLAATHVVAWGLYDHNAKAIKWWLSVGSENEPTTTMLVFHTSLGRLESAESVRRGWALWTNGKLPTARHGCMFPKTLAAARPYVRCVYTGYSASGANVSRTDGTVIQDAGTNYQGYIESKAWEVEPISRKTRMAEANLYAKMQSSTSVTLSVIKDWGAETRTEAISIAATGTETRAKRRFGIDVSDCDTFQLRIGDAAAANMTWELDRMQAITEKQGTP